MICSISYNRRKFQSQATLIVRSFVCAVVVFAQTLGFGSGSLLSDFLSIKPAQAATGTSRVINYQGRLMTSGQANVTDGTYQATFKIYSQSSGGSYLWTASSTNGTATGPSAKVDITVQNGLFSILLGDTTANQNAFPINLFDNQPLYLGVAIMADSEMSPRKQLSAVPYAFNSDALQGQHASDTVSNTGGNVFALGQHGDDAALAKRSALMVMTSGTSNLNDYLIRGYNGTDAFTVNRQGNVTTTGNLEVNGNTIIGNASSDRINVASRFVSDLVPAIDGTYSLGLSSFRWKNLFAKYVSSTAIDVMGYVSTTNLYIGGISVTSSVPTLNQVALKGNTTARALQFAGGTSTNGFRINGTLIVTGKSTLANVSSTKQDISGYLTVTGKTTLGSATATNITTTNLWSNKAILTSGTSTNFAILGFVNSDVTPQITNTYNLGTTAKRWLSLWVNNVTTTNLFASGVVSTTKLYVNGTEVTGSFTEVDTFQSVTARGATSDRWIQFAGATSTSNFRPGTSLAYDLGSSAYRWKDVWASSTRIGTSTWELWQSKQGFTISRGLSNRYFTINSNGNVGIGTTTAQSKLQISGGNILISGTAQENGIDSATKLMLHANDTGSSFVDSSLSSNTVTPHGDATQSATKSKFGGKSAYFDGTGDYLSLNYTPDFDLSNGDFTIDAWFNSNSFASGQAIISKDTYGANFDWTITIVDNDTIGCWTNGTFSSLVINVPTMSTGVWYHVALVRKNGTNTFYLNGVSYGQNAMAITNASQSSFTVGSQGWNNPSTYFNGYIDELRVSKGIARWSSDFTPPTTEYSNSVSSGIQIGFDTMPLVYNSLDVKGAFALGTYAGSVSAPANGFIVSGNVGIGTNAPTSSKLVVGGGINPSLTNSYDLGSVSYRWRKLYAASGLYSSGTVQGSSLSIWGNATHTGNIMPSVTNQYSLGNANYRWKGIWATGVTTTWLGASTVSTTRLYVNGVLFTGATEVDTLQSVTTRGATSDRWIQFAGATSTSNFRPGTNLAYDLGSSNYRWKDVWASSTRIGTSTWELWQANGGLTFSKAFSKKLTLSNAGSLLPGANNTQNIGSSGNAWNSAYVANFDSYVAMTPTLVGTLNTAGTANDTVVQGDYAYVADDSGLRIIDVSDPVYPLQTGSLAVTARDLAVAGKYAYIAGYNVNKIFIVDVSNPVSPQTITSMDITGIGYGITVAGKYMYLANDNGGLRIYDISNPIAPSLIRTVTTSGAATDVVVQGEYAYVSVYIGGLDIINISNPYAAALSANYNTPGAAWDVYVSGRYAYVADETGGLQIIDVKNPAAPVLAKSFTSVGNAYGVNVSGNYAYVESTASALYVIDVSSSTNPSVVSQYGAGGASYGAVTVAGKYAYVSDGVNGLRIFNISGINAPAASIGSLSSNNVNITGSLNSNQFSTNGLNVSGNALFSGRLGTYSTATLMGQVGIGTLTPNKFALQVAGNIGPDAGNTYSLGSSAMPWSNAFASTLNGYVAMTPTLAGSNNTAGTVYDAVVQGDYAYIADDARFRVIDVSDPAYPTETGSVSAPSARDVFVTGDYAYVAGYNNSSFYIIDISKPNQPVKVSTTTVAGVAYGIYVSGNFLYLANDGSGLKIYDISNPSSPVLIRTVAPSSSAATDLVVQGKYAYVSIFSGGLDIIDISNPYTAYRVGNYNTPGSAWDVFVAGRYAYVADEAGGLQIVDIKNPAAPVLAKSFTSVGNAYGVNVSGNYAYVESTGSALYVIDVSSSTNPSTVSQYGTGGASNGGVTVAGKYAYVSDGVNGLKVFNLTGVNAPSASIGNLATNDISVLGLISANQFNAKSLNVSGFSMFGNSIAVNGTSTMRDLVVSRHVGSDLMPWASQTYSLGDATHQWKNAFFSGTVTTTKLYVNGSLITAAGTPSWQQVTDVGANTNKWIKFSGATSVGNIMPSSTLAYDLGSSNYRWRDIFTNNITALPSSGSAYTQVATLTIGGTAVNGSHVVGNYMYVTNMPAVGDLQIIDISNPRSPTAKGYLDLTANSMWNVRVEGNYAYLVDNGGIFYVVDVSNPSVPVLVKSLALGGNPWSSDLIIQGKYAYVPSYGDSHWHAIDISVPSRAAIVGTAGGYLSLAMDVQGDVAYTVGYSNNLLYSYDISNPASPTALYSTSTSLSGTWESMVVGGRYAYLASASGQLVIVDISNPSFMRVVKTMTGLGTVNDGGAKMHLDGRYLYIPTVSNYVTVVDVADPLNPTTVNFSTAYNARSVNVKGRYAYVAGGNGNIKVFDVRGAEVNGLLAHSAELGSLQVQNNSIFSGKVMMNESAHVGLGGLTVDGLGITSYTTLSVGATGTILGGLTVGTASKTADDYFRITAAGHVGPSSTNAYDLGSSTYRWRNQWVYNVTTTNLYASGVVSTTKLYVNGTQITGGISGTGTDNRIVRWNGTNAVQNSLIEISDAGNLIPSTNLSYDLGDTTHRWKDVWASSTRIGTSTWELWQANNGFTLSKAFSKKLVVSNSGAVLPGSNNAQDLGGAVSWRNISASGTANLNSIWSRSMNISNPDSATVTEVSSLQVGGTGEGAAAIQGNYLYRVGDGNSTYLYVYDLSVPGYPSSTASLALGNSSYGIKVAGRYAITTYTGGFDVIDISNPKAPVKLTSGIASGGNEYKGVDLVGGYVYILDNVNNLLKIYDLTVPTSPTLVGSVNTGGTSPRSVAVQGKYAYITNYTSNDISIIDVSNPIAPTYVSKSTVSTSPVSIAVQGRYVYTFHYGANNMTITDVMDPANPRLVSTYNVGSNQFQNYMQSIVVSGRYAYLVMLDYSFIIVDISNPYSPRTVATKALSSYGSGVVVSGRYAYVTVYGGKLSVFSIGGIETNGLLAHSLEAGNLTVKTQATISRLTADSAIMGIGGLAVQGNFSSQATSTLRGTVPAISNAFDLGTPNAAWRNIYFDSLTQAIPVGTNFSLVYSTSTGSSKQPLDVQVVGRYAYVANYGDTVSILDISVPSAAQLMGTVAVSGEPTRIVVRGKYAYVTRRVGDAMSIIDVSDVRKPVVVGAVTGLGNPIGLAVSGMYAFVGDYAGTKGVQVVDISNPTAPYVVTSFLPSATHAPQDLYVQGDMLYVTNNGGTGVFSVYHIADPANPVLMKNLTTNYVPKAVSVQGRYAYLTDYTNGYMTVVDVSSSTLPRIVSDFNVSGNPNYIAVQGRYAYISKYQSPGYITVVDINNPASPVLIKTITTGTYNYGVFVAGRYLYSAEYGSSRLAIYDIKGAEFNGLVANSAEAGTLQVRNDAYVANQMSIGGGLTVGGAGIYSNGNISMQSWEMKQSSDGGFAMNKSNLDKLRVSSVGTLSSLNAQPARVSGVNLSTSVAYDVDVVGKFAYVAVNDAIVNGEDLQVYDISDPAYPNRLGGLNIGGGTNPRAITVVGNYAYMSVFTGFGIYDITDPKNILSKSYTSFGSNSEFPYEIRVVGKYAYMVTGGTFAGSRFFKIFDISNPSSPVQVYTTVMAEWTYSLAISGKYAFIGNSAGTILIYDVSNPYSPILVKSTALPLARAINQIEIVGPMAYFATYDADAGGTKDLIIYDISSSTNPVYKGGLDVGSGAILQSVAVGNKYAYVSSNATNNSLQIIDISSSTNPTRVSGTGNLNNVHKLALSGKYIYYTVANDPSRQEDLIIYDIGGIDAPAANLGSIQGESLDISGTAIIKNLQASNSLNVGMGGIFTDGSLGVATTGTVRDLVVSRHVGSDLMPWASQTYSLGDSTHQWKNAFFSGTVTTTKLYVNGTLVTGATPNLQQVTNAGYVTTNPIKVGGVSSTQSITPTVNGTLDLGSLAYRWRNLFLGGNVYSSGTVQGASLRVYGAATTSGNVMPSANNLYSLGNSNYRWKNIWGVSATFTSLYVNGAQVLAGVPSLQLVTNSGYVTTNPIKVAGVSTTGNILPVTSLAYDLGSSSNRWRDIWASSTHIGTSTWDLKQSSDQSFVIGRNGGTDKLKISLAGTISSVNPTLTRKSGVDLGNITVYDIQVSGKYAYIASNAAQDFQIYDISDQNNPKYLGGIQAGSEARSVYVSGNFAYVGDNTNEFAIFDISDPFRPVKKGSIFLGNNGEFPRDIKVIGKYAYTVGGGAFGPYVLRIYDISNPNSPTILSSIGLADSGISFDVSGRFAYTGDYWGGFRIFDVSNPSLPVLQDSLSLCPGCTVNDTEARGSLVYLGTNSGMYIYDVSSSTNPILMNRYNSGVVVKSISLTNNYAYITTNSNGNYFQVVNIASSTAPVRVTGFGTSGSFDELAVSGKYAYIGGNNMSSPANTDDFQIVDIGGFDAAVASIGSISSDSLDVSGSAIIKDLYANNSLYVGMGGIFTDGSLGTAATATVRDLIVSRHVGSDLMPWASQTYSLGDSTHQWKNAYFSGTVTTTKLYVNGTLVTGATPNLQQVTNAGYVTTNPIKVGGVSTTGNILPVTNKTYDLGSASKSFRNAYVSSTLYLSAASQNKPSISFATSGYMFAHATEGAAFGLMNTTPFSNVNTGSLFTVMDSDGVSPFSIVPNGRIKLGDLASTAIINIGANRYHTDSDVSFIVTTTAGISQLTMGIDTSDKDKFKISSSSALGTTDRFVIDGTGNVGIGDSSPNSLFTVGNGDLLQINSSGRVFGPSGGGNTPTYSFTADSHSGIYQGGRGTVYVGTSNSDTAIFTTSTIFMLPQAGIPGGIGFADASYNQEVYLRAPTSTLNDYYTMYLPTSAPSASSLLRISPSGSMWFDSATYLTSANAFLQGGNSFGGAATLGTNDNNTLNFEVNGTSRMQVDTNGSLNLIGTTNNSQLIIKGSVTQKPSNPLIKLTTSTGALLTSITTNNVDNLFIGSGAGRINDGTIGNYFIGNNAGYNNVSGYWNIAIGSNALSNNYSGNGNTAIGSYALNVASGSNNLAIGQQTMRYTTTGSQNTAIGESALMYNKTGSSNTVLGYYALNNNKSATGTVAIGMNAGNNNSISSYSNQYGTYIGTNSGYRLDTGSNNNTFVGYGSGYNNTSGANNTLFGYQAGDNLTTGSNNIVMGYDINAPRATGNYQLNIGNNIYGDLQNNRIGIGVPYPYTAKLVVAGNVYPSSTLSYDLGSTSYRWRDTWTETVHVGASTWDIGQVDANTLKMTQNGSTKNEFTLNSDGANTTLAITNALDNSGRFSILDSETTENAYFNYDGGTSVSDLYTRGDLRLMAGAATRMYIGYNGNINVGSTYQNNFKLAVTGDLGPGGHDIYDIGSPTNTWRSLYSKYVSTTLLSAVESRHIPSDLAGFTRLNSMDTGGSPVQVVVNGRYTYIANSPTVGDISIIADAENGATASTTAAISLSASNLVSLAVQGETLYGMTNGGYLYIVDISEPRKPVVLKELNTSIANYYGTVAVSGGYVYLSDYSNASLKVVKVTDPARAAIVATVTGLGTGPQGLVVLGNYVYVANYSGMNISAIDISDPESPVLTSNSPSFGQNLNGITAQGRYAYLPAAGGNLFIVDISSSTSMKRVKTVAMGSGTGDYYTPFVSGRYLYVPQTSNRVAVYDVQYPASAREIGYLTMPSITYSAYVSGRYLYVINASGATKLSVFDVRGVETNGLLAHSAEVGTLQVDGQAVINSMLDVKGSLSVSGDSMFGGDAHFNGDISAMGGISEKPTLPKHLNSQVIALAETNQRIIVKGRYAYMLDNGGLSVVDVSADTGAVMIGTVIPRPDNGDLVVDGNYAYVSSRVSADSNRNHLMVYDISNPKAIQKISDTALDSLVLLMPQGANTRMHLSGKTLYIACPVTSGDSQFIIADVSDPNNVHIYANRLGFNGLPNDLAVKDNKAYVTTDDRYYYIVDITTSTGPTSVSGSLEAVETEALDISENYLYKFQVNGSTGTLTVKDTYGVVADGSVNVTGAYAKAQIKVVGKYAYVMTGGVFASDKSALFIFDVSSPTAPFLISQKDYGTTYRGAYHFDISGDRIYLGENNFHGVAILDLNGLNVHTARIGQLAAQNVDIANDLHIDRDADIRGDFTVGKSLLVQDNAAFFNTKGVHGETTSLESEMFTVNDARDIYDVGDSWKVGTLFMATGTDYTPALRGSATNVLINTSDTLNKSSGSNQGLVSRVVARGASLRQLSSITGTVAGGFILDTNVGGHALLAKVNSSLADAAWFGNYSANAGANTLSLYQGCDNAAGTVIMDVYDVNDRKMYLNCAGQMYLDNGTIGTPADYAEYWSHDGYSFATGTVISLDNTNASSVKPGTSQARNSVIGVMSQRPLVTGNYPGSGEPGETIDSDKWVVVGMLGQLRTQFSPAEGAVKVGDLLMAGEEGQAVRAHGPGMVLGEALEGADATSTILVYVHPYWWAGDLLSAEGDVNYLTDDLVSKAQGQATGTIQGYDSGLFVMQGSGWDSSSETPVSTNFKLYNHTINATSSEFVIGFSTGTVGATEKMFTISNTGDVKVSGDLTVGRRLYLGSNMTGTGSTSTYIFVDDTLAPTSTYIATNADGWQTQSTYDYAERYESAEQLMPGDLITADPSGINKVMRASDVNQAILGIVSTKPGFVTGAYKPGTYPIALAGRVPTRVSIANGSITVGDYLTVLQGNPGVAVKATGAGNVVGVALESYDKVEEGLISVFVKPSYTMGSIGQTGSEAGTIVVNQTVQAAQRVEIEGLAAILAGATEVHVSFGTIMAFPMAYATPHASIEGSWWIANRTDKGFDIILSQAQAHNTDFTWLARPMRAGTVRFVSDNTYQTLDDLTGQPYGPQVSEILIPTSTSTSDGATAASPTSTEPTVTETIGALPLPTNTQTESNSTSTMP